MKIAPALRHLGAVHGKETVGVNPRGGAARAFEHGGPEQGVEVDNILADEVMHLSRAVGAPDVLKADAWLRPSAISFFSAAM